MAASSGTSLSTGGRPAPILSRSEPSIGLELPR